MTGPPATVPPVDGCIAPPRPGTVGAASLRVVRALATGPRRWSMPVSTDRFAPPAAATITTLAALASAAASLAVHADWNTSGGDAGHTGFSAAVGPDAPTIRWSGGSSSVIAWQPLVEGDRMFVVRQSGFPPAGEPNGSTIECRSVTDGSLLWDLDLDYDPGDWTTWIGGVMNGRLYAGRSGNGASVEDPLYCIDVVDGSILWESVELIDAGAYDGMTFAPNGDPIVGGFRNVTRFDARTGTTVWSTPRVCSVSSSCGGVATDEAVYIADAAPGGHVIVRIDLDTGFIEYESDVMPGFTLQNTPMVGPGPVVYLSRTQNNPLTDFLYAFEDTGIGFVERWNRRAAWHTTGELGIGPDGSVYAILPGPKLTRLDPATGATIDESPVLAGFSKPRMAIDATGRVFLGNGAFATGRVEAFEPDCTSIWSVPVVNLNIGGPVLAGDGTLIAVGNGTQVFAWRTEPAGCAGDVDGDGTVGFDDIVEIVAAWGPCGAPACAGDLDGSGDVGLPDLLIVLAEWGCGIP